MRKPLNALLLFASAALCGCSPTLFSATGHVTSSGGPLQAWSATPTMCHQIALNGDADKQITFAFANPNGNDGTRQAHPLALVLDRSSGSSKVTIQGSEGGNAVLTPATCKTLAFSSEEQHKSFGQGGTPIKGSLTLDCATPGGSHVTSDLQFDHCE